MSSPAEFEISATSNKTIGGGFCISYLRSPCLLFPPVITVRNEIAKVMFLHLSVILSTGGVYLSACWDATTPSPQTRHPPRPGPSGPAPPPDQASPWDQVPPRTRHSPPGLGTPPGADGYCCGRYASYWNAFLFAYVNK